MHRSNDAPQVSLGLENDASYMGHSLEDDALKARVGKRKRLLSIVGHKRSNKVHRINRREETR
ncbi:hypothetical protein Lal_00036758 [Lupinus albus]|nr:hypothetical protein Lal_00036758 [Lupinus albus]